MAVVYELEEVKDIRVRVSVSEMPILDNLSTTQPIRESRTTTTRI